MSVTASPELSEPPALWNEAILSNAAGNVPSFWTVVSNSRFTPPFLAALSTFIILWWLRPPFVQAEQSGEFTLPTVSFTAILGFAMLVFAIVLGASYFYKQ